MDAGCDSGGLPVDGAPWMEHEQRVAIEGAQRTLLEAELLDGRTRFESRPYEAHVQFSNFCNMSCIMCRDGVELPLVEMPDALLERFGEQVAPTLSVVTPYCGSEPLAVGWDRTHAFVRRHALKLSLTTNIQLLDERRFHEVRQVVERLQLSLDSHVPDLLAHIRPGSRPERVLANLRRAARLCREHAVDSVVFAVFLKENARTLADTVDFLGGIGIDCVEIIQVLDLDGCRESHDPLRHLSSEEVEEVRSGCVEAARRRAMRIVWNVGDVEVHDFRLRAVEPDPRMTSYERWVGRMKLHLPGYCPYVFNRMRLTADGDVAACPHAPVGQLSLGNLVSQAFEQIWNGPTAQDLRRAMQTGDVPEPCGRCRFRSVPPPSTPMPFIQDVERELGPPSATLRVHTPGHGSRHVDPPGLVVECPAGAAGWFRVVLALGGQTGEVHRFEVPAAPGPDGTARLQVSRRLWESLRPNLGYWWAAWLASDAGPARTHEPRVLVRHRALPRIEGSTLRYSGPWPSPPGRVGAWLRRLLPARAPRRNGNPSPG